MARPRVVDRMAREAEELIAQQRNGTAPQTPPADPPAAPPQEAPPADPPAAPPQEEPSEPLFADEPGMAPQQQGDDDPDRASPLQVAPPPGYNADPEPDDTAGWAQRYRVLQGKYNAETSRSSRTIARLEGRIDQLENLLANMSSAPKREPERPPEPEPELQFTPVEDVSAQDLENYGEDLLTAASRHSLAKISPTIQSMLKEIQSLRAKLETTAQSSEAAAELSAQASLDRMADRMDATFPEWRQLNNDSAFLDWLEETDEFSDVPRRQLLQNAVQRRDAARTLRFFQRYAEHANGGEHVAPAPKEPKVDPATLASPGRGRQAPRPSAQPEKIQWTPDDVARFYDDVRRGAFRKNPAEQARLEEDIFAAQREGRVTSA